MENDKEEKREKWFPRTDNDVSLREYIETKISHLKVEMSLTFEMNKIALDKAETIMNERFIKLNEYKNILSEQGNKFVTKSEFDILYARVQEDIRVLRESKATLEGKASASSVYISYVISAIGLVLAIIGIALSIG